MKIHCLYDEKVPVLKLKEHPKNRNTHPSDQIDRLAKILDYQGWRYPIKVSRQSGFITSGHGRLLAAVQNEWKEVPVNYQDYESDEQEYADVQADNAIAAWAELDLSGINTDIGDLGPDFDIDLLGLKDFTIEPADKLDPQCDEDEVPEKVEPKSRLGDLYQLGRHRLLCGDSTSVDAVDRLMAGEKADMVFTDPPYNVASESRNYAAGVSKAMSDLESADWDKEFDVKPALSCIMSVCAASVTVYVWTSQFLIQKIWDHLNEWCDFTGYCVWSKPNPMPSLSKRHWTWNTELCVYGTRGTKRVVNFPEGQHAPNVWEVTKQSDGTHPTQKPIALCEHPILFSSGPGQSVLDLFGGSGSTLIACEKTNRRCFMMEIDPHYCDVIISRFEKYSGKKAELINEATDGRE